MAYSLILKLTNGDELIANIDSHIDDQYTIVDPMVIVGMSDPSGSPLRLKDYMLLSNEPVMTIPGKFVITTYIPLPALEKYYQNAVLFNRKNTRPTIVGMIESASQNMAEMNDDVEQLEADFRNAFGSPIGVGSRKLQ